MSARFLKLALIVAILGSLYLLAVQGHADRDRLRQATVELTPNCVVKLHDYALRSDERYLSPYLLKMTRSSSELRGYSEEDVRAIQRGCNIVDDLQGYWANGGPRERWHANRFVRGTQTTCAHCHQGVGDKQDAAGNRLVGSNSMGASWVMADMYDRFTGLLLSHEWRQMQCYINSSNGYKPNIDDDLIRDVTAYSRLLPTGGIEDPATGSAVGPAGCFAAKYGFVPRERVEAMTFLQGVLARRPSRLHVKVVMAGADVTSVQVGGASVVVGEGTMGV